jgi:hypothetical protein
MKNESDGRREYRIIAADLEEALLGLDRSRQNLNSLINARNASNSTTLSTNQGIPQE